MGRSGSARKKNNRINQLMSSDSNKSSYKIIDEKTEQKSAGTAYSLNFSREGMVNGLIMAEVFGKPKCLRRGR